jgi:hypothetical protein
MEISAHDEDIRAYVRGRICRDYKLSRNVGKDAVLREDIEKTVVGRAEKM